MRGREYGIRSDGVMTVEEVRLSSEFIVEDVDFEHDLSLSVLALTSLFVESQLSLYATTVQLSTREVTRA